MVATHADSSRGLAGVGFSAEFMFLSVIPHTVSQKPVHVRSPNLTLKCSTMSPGNSYMIAGLHLNAVYAKFDGQGYRSSWSQLGKNHRRKTFWLHLHVMRRHEGTFGKSKSEFVTVIEYTVTVANVCPSMSSCCSMGRSGVLRAILR